MKQIIPVLAALIIVGTGCTKEISENKSVSEEQHTLMAKLVGGSEGEIDPGSLLVKLDAETTKKIMDGGISEVADDIFGDAAVKSFTRAIPIMPKNADVARKYGLDRWFTVEFDDEIEPQAIARKMAASASVSSIQYSRRIFPITTEETFPAYDLPVTRASEKMLFDDPHSIHQWNLHNDGSLDDSAVAGADIGVKDAWRLTGGDPSVVVAVIDRGIAYRHDDLKANMWVNEAELTADEGGTGQATVDDDGNGFIDDKYGFNFVKCRSISTDFINDKVNPGGDKDAKPSPAISSKGIDANTGTSHGTHVAGIIAATNGNGMGISSIAGGTGKGDGVRIMCCQVDDGEGGFASDVQIALAYIYAADNGACIAQCSYGHPTIMTNDEAYKLGDGKAHEGAPLEYAAIQYFLDPGNSNHPNLRGNMAVYSAGNDTQPYSRYPGALRDVISVTAIGYDMLPTGYTNYGPGCKISAPGGEIRKVSGELYHPSMILSTGTFHNMNTQPGVNTGTSERPTYSPNYVYMYGTSMACPHVSGVLALGISYAQKLGKSFTRETMTSLLLTSVNDLDQYLERGTKDNCFIPSENEFKSIPLDRYHGKMGTGLVNAWKFLMAIEGTPSVIVRAGEKASIDLSEYCNASNSYNISIDNATKASLGLESDPVIRNGKLEITCTKVGAGKVRLSAEVGKDPDKDNGIGSMAYSREISIVSREFATKNGGWL